MDTSTRQVSLMARSYIYRVLSASFLCPNQEYLTFLTQEAEAHWLREAFAILTNEAHKDPWDALKAFEGEMAKAKELSAMESEYGHLFTHTMAKECPAYETQYGAGHIFQQTQELADIAGFYTAFGLEVSDQAKERADHISVELEFMSFLAHKEAYALEHHGEEKATLCREAQAKFLQDHLGRWAPLFATLLARKAGDGFYRALARFSEVYLALDATGLGIQPQAYGDVQVSDLEPESGCFSCPEIEPLEC
ncbi:MAG: molecular chaperone TorD family protein [Acidobacteria bacterium]|nr:molecular chaperone TorD family protein [Acidobacteriota bacterium]MBI3655216.1 molecular chaperone TorD family protein [Acidobacteriota bacterium]